MRTFQQYLENVQGLLGAIRDGDHVAFNAYLDDLEESGKPIPELLKKWRVSKFNPPYHVNWTISKNYTEIEMIEYFGTDNPLSVEDIASNTKPRNRISQVVNSNDGVVGYFVYNLNEGTFEIVRLTVHPLVRRRGVGKALINKMKSKLNQYRRTAIVVHNVPANMIGFFVSQGFVKEGDNYTFKLAMV